MLGENRTDNQPEIRVSDPCFLVRAEEYKKCLWWKYHKCTTTIVLFVRCFMAKGRLWGFLCCRTLGFFLAFFYVCLEKIYNV